MRGGWVPLLLLLPGTISAVQGDQTFPITVHLASEAGAPIPDALVRLISGDSTLAQRFTNEAGLARFTVPAAGDYRFLAERLGYATWESDPMRLDGARTELIELRMREEAIALDAIGIEMEGRCSQDRPLLVRAVGIFGRILRGSESATEKAAKSARLARVHAKTMAALRTVVESRPAARYTLRHIDEEPQFKPPTYVVSGSLLDTSFVRQAAPIQYMDPEQLAQHGYLDAPVVPGGEATFHMVTPEVMTSEAFTLTHCFEVVEQPDSGWVGLAFEPVAGSSNYDVRGVAWIDTLAWRPQRIEFNYTRLAEFLVRSGMFEYATGKGMRTDQHELSRSIGRAFTFERRLNRDVGGPDHFTLEAAPAPDEKDFGGVLEFGEADIGYWDVIRWTARWPGLLGSVRWGGHDLGRRFRGVTMINVYYIRTATVLHYSRRAEIIEITGPGGGDR